MTAAKKTIKKHQKIGAITSSIPLLAQKENVLLLASKKFPTMLTCLVLNHLNYRLKRIIKTDNTAWIGK